MPQKSTLHIYDVQLYNFGVFLRHIHHTLNTGDGEIYYENWFKTSILFKNQYTVQSLHG